MSRQTHRRNPRPPQATASAISAHPIVPDYGDVWAPFYDTLYAERSDVKPLVAYVSSLSSGRDVLEFGIGTGRIALALACAGWQVTGVELSAAMLQSLRGRPEAASLDVHVGDFTTVQLSKSFDVVLLNFNGLFLLRRQEDQIRCFANAARHLRPGGHFVIEAFVPDHTRWSRGQNVSLASINAQEVDLLVAQHDRALQTILAQHVTIDASGVKLRPTLYRYAWPAEIDLMAHLAGLTLQERWAGYGREPFTSESGQHVSAYKRR